jgi:5-methylcytosine-specific restriction enzyme A
MGKLSAASSRLKTAGNTLRVPAKKAENFYQSKEWKEAAEKCRRRHGHRCVKCNAHRRTGRQIVDHIIERKDGGADFEQSNLQLLCLPCHNRKTARAKATRNRSR